MPYRTEGKLATVDKTKIEELKRERRILANETFKDVMYSISKFLKDEGYTGITVYEEGEFLRFTSEDGFVLQIQGGVFSANEGVCEDEY